MIKPCLSKKAFLFVSFFCLVLIGLLYTGFKQGQKKQALSQAIRIKFKAYLKPLPPPPFKKILGRVPSLASAHLGRMLFNDPILSRNNDVSCATCHLSNHGFADGNRLNFGALGRGGPTGDNVGSTWGKGALSLKRHCGEDGSGFFCEDPMFRNSLSTLNVIYRAHPHTDSGLLWDGRFGRLAFQVLLPIHTPEEMCGANPVPLKNNPFKEGGPLFNKPITVRHSHLYLPVSGKQIFSFNSPPQTIHGIQSFRQVGTRTIPARNECMAIAVAKIRKIPYYNKQFKKIYKKEVDDLSIGKALSDFVSTHIAHKSPYDFFVNGANSLSEKQLKGLAMFMLPLGETWQVHNDTYKGVGCAHCHSPPFFGGEGFYSLGVKGDDRSSLSHPGLIVNRGGFALNVRSSHGKRLPTCHVLDESASLTSASPDIGRAIATSDKKDCFKFRVPVLRNVIETYPYFHHGTETGLTSRDHRVDRGDFKALSLYALKQAIKYHLRGPIDIKAVNSLKLHKVFFDPFFQLDPLVPGILLDFGPTSFGYGNLNLSQRDLSALLDFVAFALYDPQAVKVGYLKNQLGHPKSVPSGLSPSITRDNGTQWDFIPLQ